MINDRMVGRTTRRPWLHADRQRKQPVAPADAVTAIPGRRPRMFAVFVAGAEAVRVISVTA